ncbi:tripartite tricarboxylate transporter TctB family protein [Pseudonocardia nigra]|uniref:tripartite tricarboxylate transporter TctB family protein n=1 Tax=Pseudonocardia nigra TaxID=1921578 RepID=UPI001C5D3D76|nr:tripartite tricarboxylate transporter TctB family protein [Pseudonocardia nigra]
MTGLANESTAMRSGPGSPRAAIGEVVAFGVLTVLGAAVFASSFGYGLFGEGGRVGPGLLPMVCGLLLALLAGGQLLARLRRRSATPAPERPAGEDVDVLGRTAAYRVRQLRTVVVALPVTVLLVPLIGFLPAFGLLVLFVSAVVERRRPVPALLVTVIAVAVVYGVFGVFLDVPLPTGVVGDLVEG